MDRQPGGRPALKLVESACSICGSREHATRVAEGEDFEYRTSDDVFAFYRCEECRAMFLHPRPDRSEISTIYPDDYHAYEFTDEAFGLSYEMRRRMERRRLADWCSAVPPGGAIVDIGAGDGFHLDIVRQFGDPTWLLEAVEPDPRAAASLERRGIRSHSGFLEDLALPSDFFDLALMIMVIEHVDDPGRMLREARRILRPGGRVGIVTDNIASLDARIFSSRHWGGYHFPRHFNLFDKEALSRIAVDAGFELVGIETMMSPVNWTYSIHNRLVDRGDRGRLAEFFSLKSPVALAFFSALDLMLSLMGRGALLRAVFRKPAESGPALPPALSPQP